FLCLPASRAGYSRRALRRNGVCCGSLSHVDRGASANCRHTSQGGRLVNIVEARDVTRSFPMPAGPVVAVRGVSLRIAPGEYAALVGPSGCGKSTLLHLLGCVDGPTSGTLLFDDHDVAALDDRQRSHIRLTRIGFIFQRFFLLPMLTAAENVELPQAEAGVSK